MSASKWRYAHDPPPRSPQRNPRRVPSIGFALTIAALIICAGSWQQAEYYWDAQDQASENARHADYDVRDRCVSKAPLDKRNCTIETRREQRSYERYEQDLYAQKTAAFWTALMGSAAIIGMMLSAIGVWLVYTTFRETRRTANAAIQSAAHSETSAKAATEANEITRMSMRPHVDLRIKVVASEGPEGCYVYIWAQNVGRGALIGLRLYDVAITDSGYKFNDLRLTSDNETPTKAPPQAPAERAYEFRASAFTFTPDEIAILQKRGIAVTLRSSNLDPFGGVKARAHHYMGEFEGVATAPLRSEAPLELLYEEEVEPEPRHAMRPFVRAEGVPLSR